MNKDFGEGNGPQVDLTAFDPRYIMPVGIKGEIDNLFNAFGAVGLLAEAAETGNGPDVSLSDLAAVHHAFASLGKRLMADIPADFTHARGA